MCGVWARLGRVKRSLIGQHLLLDPTGRPFFFSFLTQPDFKQLPPYCPDISRELVIIQTCLLGLNVQSGVIKPPSLWALTRYPHTSGGGRGGWGDGGVVRWGADGANKCARETARVQPSPLASRTNKVPSNSLQSVLMASGADAREAEVSATLNLFNREKKREKTWRRWWDPFGRSASFIYLFLKRILRSPNRRGGSGGVGSGGLLCRWKGQELYLTNFISWSGLAVLEINYVGAEDPNARLETLPVSCVWASEAAESHCWAGVAARSRSTLGLHGRACN